MHTQAYWLPWIKNGACRCRSSKKTICLSEVASTFAQDLSNVPSCNCLQFGRESVHLCKWNTYQSIYREVQGTFLRGDGLTSAHTDLHCIAKYVIEWGSSKRGDKTGRSCSFLEMNEKNLWYTVSFGLLLICSTFSCTFLHRRRLLELGKSGGFGGYFWRQKSALLSTFTSRSTKWLRQGVLFVVVDDCGKYFCSVRWNGRVLNFYPLTMA